MIVVTLKDGTKVEGWQLNCEGHLNGFDLYTPDHGWVYIGGDNVKSIKFKVV